MSSSTRSDHKGFVVVSFDLRLFVLEAMGLSDRRLIRGGYLLGVEVEGG